MGLLKIVTLNESDFSACEKLRCHPNNLSKGELRQIRPGGFFDYYNLISSEHYHWGVIDGPALLGMVSLAVARTPSHTVVLMTDFFSQPESRQRLASRKIIERVHEFIETLSGPVVLLAIENRYRLLDSLLPIAKRFGFIFKAEQILQSVAVSCASVASSSAIEGLTSERLSESPESVRRILAGIFKTDLSWPPESDLLERIVRIDPDARLISIDSDMKAAAILYSESAYRSYEGHTHMNIIASDERLLSAGAEWAEHRGCDWLLMREPFPCLSRHSWPGRLNFNNRLLVGYREQDGDRTDSIGIAHLFQGMTL